jgi:asparagine synthase (glutamine-hydrolysing)
MCAICGIVYDDSSIHVDQGQLIRMRDQMIHRGPDDAGVLVQGRIGLGHRRLSIIDVKGGHQPISNEDVTIWIVFNGEIYNYPELRANLVNKGHRFRTNSDTETIVHLYEEFGPACVEHLNGMFAFAIWNGNTQGLFLARDRMGVKPLYYWQGKGIFIFASEIKSLLTHDEVSSTPSLDALGQYLSFRYPPGDRTMFDGIRSLEPGHTLIWEEGEVRISKYWHMRFTPQADSKRVEESIEELDWLLNDAVRIRLMSEVPLGTYCSGGVDSSLITAYAARNLNSTLNTFSVGFEDPAYDESFFAKKVSAVLGTNHHPLVVTEKDFTEALPRAIWLHDSPLNHPNSVPIYLLSQMAKCTVTVMLSGEGSDELFAGYPRYKIILGRAMLDSLPALFRRAAAWSLSPFGNRKLHRIREALSMPMQWVIASNAYFLDEPTVHKLCQLTGDAAWKGRVSVLTTEELDEADPLSRLQYLELKTYLVSLLDRQDKMSMGAGIESRVPFLDYRLVEWSLSVSSAKKIHGLQNKHIIKRLASRYLPKSVVYRSKSGFGVPIARWLRNRKGFGKYLELLRTQQFRQREHWNHVEVDRLIREHLSGSHDHSDALWEIINVELWWDQFISSSVFSRSAA